MLNSVFRKLEESVD
ncbi:hypothetical protein [Salmonella enterica]